MPARLFQSCIARWRFRLLILLLQIPAMTLSAADKRLASFNVPVPVAHGNVAPLGRVPATNQIRLALDLPLRNAGELTNLLAAIYNPASPQYHHYLKPGEFAVRFGPTVADYAVVMNFAKTNGLTVAETHPSRLMVDVTGKAADVERAFHVKLHSFRHPTERRNFFAPDTEPTVDARLPLFHVSGLDNFSRPHPNSTFNPGPPGHQKFPSDGSSPYGTFMGNDFRNAYLPGTTLTGAGQNVGLVQFDGFNGSDITNYANVIGLTNSMPQTVVMPVDGGVPYTGTGISEVELDIEMVMSISPGVSNIYVYEAPDETPWEDMLGQMADDDLAAQLSTSWSGGGPDPAAEQIFLQMAVQGQTFFCASGDTGAFVGQVVSFPCASPNVTEVGGTYLATDTNGNYLGEVAWNRGGDLATSGGAGPGVAIPQWQLGLDMSANGGSSVCRNIPDVAFTADEIYVIVEGQGGTALGTSCAAPLWAGLTALINQQAGQLGQPPPGFLNPAIYALCRGTNYPALFHDITAGNNTNEYCPTNFCAVPGYDLCTGWGTPAGTNLINALTTSDYLGILPPAVCSASGLLGGPLSQTNWTITLTNAGPVGLDWSLGGMPSWLTVSTSGGRMPANGSTNINLQLVNPKGWPCGDYYAVLSVTNLALSRVQNLTVEVDIGQSIVQNGGFETGDFSDWTFTGDTIIGGTVCNAVEPDWVVSGVAYNFSDMAHSGYFGAFLRQIGYAATLSQTLVTTPGQQYVVSYWLSNPVSGSMQTFNVSWNGADMTDFGLTNPPVFGWTSFQCVVTACDTNSTLEFAAENDVVGFNFDDVSVTPVPLAFTSYSISTNAFQCAWPSRAGLNYLVQYTSNLAQGGWQTICSCTAWTNVTTYVDTNSPSAWGQGFYRLVLVP
ncbi:MAG TPA: protease pro-enzyme activation domain-containing protein [Verrucomicrobiae bacterium]|nr:protease pro-enzyme activation domain-containing protein [Verrucomicrobiae bacterium]